MWMVGEEAEKAGRTGLWRRGFGCQAKELGFHFSPGSGSH